MLVCVFFLLFALGLSIEHRRRDCRGLDGACSHSQQKEINFRVQPIQRQPKTGLSYIVRRKGCRKVKAVLEI